MKNEKIFAELDGKDFNKLFDSDVNKLKYFAFIIAFVHGIINLMELSIFYYQKDDLKLSPNIINYFSGIIFIPWSVKPVIAFMIDKVKEKINSIRYIIVVSCLIDFLLIFLLSKFRTVEPYIFLLLMTFHQVMIVLQIISAETILIIISKHNNTSDNTNQGAQNISNFFIFRYIGTIFGTIFSGKIMEYCSKQEIFFISSFFPIIIIISSIFINEQLLFEDNNEDDNDTGIKKFINDLKIIKKSIFTKEITILIVFVFLLNSSPSFDSIMNYYYTDYLKFSPNVMANLRLLSLFFYLFGLFSYNYFFKDVKHKKFYTITNILLFVVNLSSIILVLGINNRLGINDIYFCFLSFGAISFFSELNFIPILSICTGLCPKNLEGTTFSIFTSILNFSGNFALFLGSLINIFIGVTSDNFTNLWLLLVIQNIYYLIFMLILTIIKFPSKNNTANKELALQE